MTASIELGETPKPPAQPIRALLPRAHAAFFGRFAGPTAIQAQAIPVILGGGDVLVCAPTGTGKTEAYTAPVVERLLAEPRAPLRFLIVSPTRALANDLFRRLEPVFAAVALPFGRLTGEHKERVDGRSPDVAVTTPEALDSMLARRPHTLAPVTTIALDEIHVLDGTPRGDQLRLLLHRLDRVTRRPPQRLAASATVPRPESLAARYLREARVVAHAGGRAIQARAFSGRAAADMARHVDAIAEAGHRKILVFCNSRAGVEDLASGLRGATRFGSAVHPHHGSLSRPERERAERRFLEAPAAVAVATMTLELGIDIGSVDYVLLDGPPPSVSSLLQRIGRGGRRAEGPARAGYAFAGEAQRQLMRTLLQRAAAGDLCADETSFRPSVLVQQAIVLAGGSGTVSAEALGAVLPDELRASFGPDALAAILAEMVEHELLDAPLRGQHALSERTERGFARGTVHGNIDPEGGLDVVDRLSGDVIGRVPSPEQAGDSVQLGGRAYVAVREVEGVLLTDTAGKPAAARFAPRAAPSLAFALGRAFASDLGAAPEEILQGRHGTSTLLIHGLGAVGGRFLAELITTRLGRGAVLDTSPMKLRLARPLIELPRPLPEDAARHARVHERWLARRLGMGPYHAKLPGDLRAEAVRRASPLDAVAAFLQRARLREWHPTDELPGFWGDL